MVMTDTRAPAPDVERHAASVPNPGGGTNSATHTGDPELLEAGTHVDVRSTLDQRWSGGFVVVSAGPAGYRLRRASDDTELPGWVPADQVRRERRRNTWWI